MVIDAKNINHLMGMALNDPGVATGNASIGSSIDERTLVSAGSMGHVVPNFVILDLAHIRMAVDMASKTLSRS
jgi:hypothetical protein